MKCEAYDFTKVDATSVPLLTHRRRRILEVKRETASEEIYGECHRGRRADGKGHGCDG
jgi:hypothetical protein